MHYRKNYLKKKWIVMIFWRYFEKSGDEWLDYLKNDSWITSISYARYGKSREKIIGFGMKNSRTLPSLGWKCCKSLSNESDEPVYT